MKQTLLTIIILAGITLLSAQSGERDSVPEYFPVAFTNSYSWEDLDTRQAGGGLIVQKGDSLQIVALYSGNNMDVPSSRETPENYGNLDFLIQKTTEKHQFFSLLKSYSDLPLAGGMETFTFVGGYGYELYASGNHSFRLGASLAVSDWGLETPAGKNIPVLPLPFIHYDFTSALADISLDFTTSPMMDIVLAPRSRFHLNGSFLLVDPGDLSGRGMKYDISGEYRFFRDTHPLGDFAGLRFGILAEDYEAVLDGTAGETYSLGWKALYGTLDLSLLELTGGYLMEGREYASDGAVEDLGRGFFWNLQLAYAF